MNIICPRCRHSLQIQSKNKKMEWDGKESISIERFECTWEMGEERDGGPANDNGFVMSGTLCRWRVVVERGVAKDA